ncbi:MAG: gliding motility protein GldC [Bacteroidia bacterium]
MAKTSEVNITVTLDENQVPESISWSATDTDIKERASKAMVMAFWDEQEKNTMRMDLWTKDMSIDEMKQFVHQTFVTLTDTFERATNEKQMVLAMRDFCDFFVEKMNLKAPENN